MGKTIAVTTPTGEVQSGEKILPRRPKLGDFLHIGSVIESGNASIYLSLFDAEGNLIREDFLHFSISSLSEYIKIPLLISYMVGLRLQSCPNGNQSELAIAGRRVITDVYQFVE